MTRTTRVLVAVAVALVATGGALLYVGTRGHSTPGFEKHLPRGGPLPSGFAVGKLHVTGGPVRRNGTMPDSPLPGVVDAHHPGDPVALDTASVGADGRFRLRLPPGEYELVATPTNAGIAPPNAHVVTIRVGQTVYVDFAIQAT